MLDNIKVHADELLKTLKENKIAHCGLVKTLQAKRKEEFSDRCHMEMSNISSAIKEGRSYQPENFNLPVPEDHSADYDTAIKMVEMSVNREIEMTQHQFEQLVMDKWSWSRKLQMDTQFYGGVR